MTRASAIAAFVAAVACAVPATAGAATITEEGGTLVVRGEGSEGLSLLVSDRDAQSWDGTPRRLSFSDSGADRLVSLTPLCQAVESSSGHSVECEFSATRPIRIEGSAAADSISIFSADDVPDSIPIEIHGGAGDDELKDAHDGEAGRVLRGGEGADKVIGYGGADRIFGDGGNDPELDGGAGDDEVRGGDGDDLLWGDHYKAPGADLLDGGPGTDVIDGEWTQVTGSSNPPATVSLDGQANDGRPGEGDNVVAVETIKGYIGLTFTGSDGPEVVDMLNPPSEQPNTLRGMGGNDRLIAKDAGDTVDGGAGDDHVEGGYGDDTVVGGPGRDTILGDKSSSQSCWYSCVVPFGNDTIDARDGEADSVDCGVGEDTAAVDAVDSVANCERVTTAGGGGGQGAGGAGGGQGAGGAGGGGTGAAKPRLAGGSTFSALLRRKVSAVVACPAACTVTAKLTVAGKPVATGRTTRLSAGVARVRLTVARKHVRRVRRLRKATATLTVSVRDATGTQRRTAKVRLRR